MENVVDIPISSSGDDETRENAKKPFGRSGSRSISGSPFFDANQREDHKKGNNRNSGGGGR